jgi:hypothetical protein
VDASGGRRSVNFGGELERLQRAAAVTGLKFNAWVVRACREQAELEAAIAKQDAESRVGIERDGVDTPAALAQRSSNYSPNVTMSSGGAVRPFVPDFKGGK